MTVNTGQCIHNHARPSTLSERERKKGHLDVEFPHLHSSIRSAPLQGFAHSFGGRTHLFRLEWVASTIVACFGETGI
jgi:hypothetical protein